MKKNSSQSTPRSRASMSTAKIRSAISGSRKIVKPSVSAGGGTIEGGGGRK